MYSETKTIRAFIAVELAREVKKELARVENILQKVKSGAKWVDPDNTHITLKFLGNIDESKVDVISGEIEKIADASEKLKLFLKNTGAFPDMERVRVVWVGLDGDKDKFINLAGKIEESMIRLGYKKDDNMFSPHITIARVMSGENINALKDAIKSINVNPINIAISGISLFRSELSPGGVKHFLLRRALFPQNHKKN